MSKKPIASGDLVSFAIKIDGTPISDINSIQSIEVQKGVNQIPIAKIILTDGDSSTGEFAASSSNTFVPGNSITIEAGYDDNNTVIFKGLITKQNIQINENIGSVLIVECRDEAIKMIVGRKSLTYSKQKDSDIITTIINNYSGLSAAVSPTSIVWPEQVQYYTTDWDYIIARAETNGMIVTSINGKVSVFKPDAENVPVFTITYGDNLLEFNATLDAITQLGSVKASSWDFTAQKIISGGVVNKYSGPGNLSSKKLSEVLGISNYELQSSTPINNDELTELSNATLIKSAFSKITGEVKFNGNNLVDPGKYITLTGLGNRFNGDHIISNIQHIIEQGRWMTKASIGLSISSPLEEPDRIVPSAPAILPGAKGLFNAKVLKMHEDPANQYRILINIPSIDPNGNGIWARLTNFYSTSGSGTLFMPEVGDEVVVGFLSEDPRYPIILGSMYSSSENKPFQELNPDEKNSIKSIASKTGINIRFNDKDQILAIETPNENCATFNDKNKEITINDQNNNSIVMSESGILLKSGKNLTLDATQKLIFKGNEGILVESSMGDVQIKALNITNKADMQFTAEGEMTASLQGGTETTIKGGMVMIN